VVAVNRPERRVWRRLLLHARSCPDLLAACIYFAPAACTTVYGGHGSGLSLARSIYPKPFFGHGAATDENPALRPPSADQSEAAAAGR